MIRESLTDTSLNRLSRTFGARLLVRPPASAEEIAKLEQLVGPIPREFAAFLLTCDGLRLRQDPFPRAAVWSLWHIHDMVSSFLNPQGPSTPPSILPFCGDPLGPRDCLVTCYCPARGAIVRWDPYIREVELLATSFGHYFDRWCDYQIERCLPGGKSQPGKIPRFDAEYIADKHPDAVELCGDENVVAWLHELDHIESSGDDFE